MTKTSQDNNLNNIIFLKYFYEYHTEKYRDVKCLILKVLPWLISYYCFFIHIQSLVELESEIVATAPYFEHTAPLTSCLLLSMWFSFVFYSCICLSLVGLNRWGSIGRVMLLRLSSFRMPTWRHILHTLLF